MPSLAIYKNNLLQKGHTVGQSLRSQSNDIMEGTWWNDTQSKVAYLYDYYHDDFDSKGNTLCRGMSYENTNKTKVFIKHIFDTYSSMNKDTPEMYVQFIPSFKLDNFSEEDEMYYFKTDYQDRYGSMFPVGMYIDIEDPDREGIYEKYLICKPDINNMFPKYMILKCDYNLQYVEISENKRYKRHIWGVSRSQSSYNSGLWTDRIITSQENQEQIMLPLNPLTEYIDTVHSDGSNMRVLVGAPTKHIKSWQISKMQDGATPARGVKTLTLYQDEVKPTDLIDVTNKEFYADYYSAEGLPAQDEVVGTLNATINTLSDTIKVGGSYKTLTVTVIDANGNDVTATYIPSIAPSSWECFVDGVNMTSSSLVTWLPQATNETMKIKLEKDYTYIKKELVINCNITPTLVGTITLSII